MNEIFAAFSNLIGQVIFWATVAPWEQAIRVRAGKHVRRLEPGFHWRVPILDQINKQSVRLRTAHVPTQTLSTKDGFTVVAGAAIGYAIADIEKLYRGLHHAEDTLTQMTAAALADCVFSNNRVDVTPDHISACVTEKLTEAFDPFGLEKVTVRVTDFAFVRAIRLVQDQRYGNYGEPLMTQEHRAR